MATDRIQDIQRHRREGGEPVPLFSVIVAAAGLGGIAMIKRTLDIGASQEALAERLRASTFRRSVATGAEWAAEGAGFQDDLPVLIPSLRETQSASRSIAAVLKARLARLRDLGAELIIRDFKLRYKGSLLGIAWSLLTPLSFLLVLNFVFTVILPLGIPDYASFLFVGILVWGWFAESLIQATGAIVDNRELVRLPRFPVAVLPIVTVAVNVVHFVLALPVLATFLWIGGVRPGPTLLVLPILIGVQFLFTLSIAYFMAALHLTFRDTKHLLGVALTLGFYATPVFYSHDQAPERLRAITGLNPMARLIEANRAALLHGTLPDAAPLVAVTAVSLLLLALGYAFFMRVSHHFVDEL